MRNRVFDTRGRLFLSGALLMGAVAVLFLITGCAAGPIEQTPEKSQENSVLVYASEDGIYERELIRDGNRTDGESRLLYKGEAFSGPVFSEDGTRLIFRQTLEPTQAERDAGTSRSVLYVHDFSSGQTIELLENPVSCCAGPSGSFFVSTGEGQVMKADFSLEERDGKTELVPEMEALALGAEAVPERASITSVLYENLKSSPDFQYLAYNITVYDDDIVDENWEGGHHSGVYSGGLYLLDLKTGKTSLVVKPIPAFQAEDGMGNNPEPGPWSRDGKVLCVWDKFQSGSMTADGTACFFYHTDTGKRTEYGEYGGLLAYDENISFSGDGTAVALGGGGRDMFENKWLDYISDYSGSQMQYGVLEEIETAGLIPAMPRISADGETLYFAAVEEQSVYPLKRQLYSMKLSGDRQIVSITSDPEYRCESLVLLGDEKYLVFGRGSAKEYDGKMEIWMTSIDGKEEIKLAEWTETADADVWMTDRYDDYYGRGGWRGIFAVYGASE
jgi:hypothetical protein